jgi:hypothetical protein
MSDTIHLEVVQGEDKGKTITLPEEGGRVGRSSKNDVVLADPLLSRHHCRAYFGPEGDLWLADLGSANQTIVNGVTIQDTRLHTGDRITLGDTVMRVVIDTLHPAAEDIAPVGTGAPVVDLGLADDEAARSAPRKLNRARLMLIAFLVLLLALFVWVPKAMRKFMQENPEDTAPAQPVAATEKTTLEYEKIVADTENIFRYCLVISADDRLTVHMDDLANNRHVQKTEQLDRQQVETLTREILDIGFFDGLAEEYLGVEPDILTQWDLRVTVGHRTHRCRVRNRVEPKLFRQIRERIETFGQAELDLWATQFPTEKLLDMAREAFLLGKKMYGEREVKYGNLSAAIRSFREADFNLQSVEDKPDYTGEILSSIRDCEKELDNRHEEHNFRAVRAMNNHLYEEAAHELRILLELIPDREDERNREARNRLLEVETRLQRQR